MAYKNPVVVSADGKKHETLGDGDALAPGSIPISAASGNGLSAKADGLYAEAGGGGGGGETSVGFVSLASFQSKKIGDIKAQYDAMKNGETVVTVPTQWHYLATLDSGEAINSARNSVYLTAVPMGDGQVISWDGLSSQGAAYGNYVWQHERLYVEGGETITLASQTDPMVIRHDASLAGEGSTRNSLGVSLSAESGNSLSLKSDGLFAAGGSGTVGYGAATIVSEATDLGVVEARYNDLLSDTTITEGVSVHYASVTSGGEAIDYAGQGVMLSAVPAGNGVIATYAGIISGTNKQVLRVRYNDGTNQVLLVENTLERTLNTDGTLTGNGDVSSALGVQVSADLQNELTILQPENSDTPGLFSRPISAMLFAADDSITKTSSYQGNPKNAAINVRLSTRANNALKLIPQSESATERGLFVPPSSTLTRGTGSGNWSFNYPDNKSAKNACGMMGTGVYWKITTTMADLSAGTVAVVPKYWITRIPCLEDGTLVPYQIIVDYVTSTTSAPTVALWLICMGVPTHLMDITSGTLTKLQRSENGLNNGLDSVYPLAPEGEYAQEPRWSREYFYSA